MYSGLAVRVLIPSMRDVEPGKGGRQDEDGEVNSPLHKRESEGPPLQRARCRAKARRYEKKEMPARMLALPGKGAGPARTKGEGHDVSCPYKERSRISFDYA